MSQSSQTPTECKTVEELAIELLTTGKSMTHGEQDARRLLDSLRSKWLRGGDATFYRALHGADTLAIYAAAAEARKHCEFVARDAFGSERDFFWREGEDTVDQPEDGPAYLVQSPRRGVVLPTGLAICPVAVKAAFDEDGAA